MPTSVIITAIICGMERVYRYRARNDQEIVLAESNEAKAIYITFLEKCFS